MKPVTPTKLEDHSLAPQFDLPATKVHRARLWDYKGRRNLAIVFVISVQDSAAQAFLEKFAGHYGEYGERNTEVLVISQDNIEVLERIAGQLGLPFPLASDVNGETTAHYTDCQAAVFVVDKYGEVYAQSAAASPDELPAREEILDWLHLIELECPECGAPAWQV